MQDKYRMLSLTYHVCLYLIREMKVRNSLRERSNIKWERNRKWQREKNRQLSCISLWEFKALPHFQFDLWAWCSQGKMCSLGSLPAPGSHYQATPAILDFPSGVISQNKLFFPISQFWFGILPLQQKELIPWYLCSLTFLWAIISV